MTLTLKVEIAFTTDPDDPSPSWTDVSAYVLVGSSSVDITRGRGDLYSSIQPSTASFTLDNSDGRFTAGYASGAYYPNVILGRRVRISMKKDAGAYQTRFDGVMESWPTQWAPTAKYAVAQVTATDRLKKLGRQVITDNIVSATINVDGPTDYWDLGDAAGTVNPRNRVGPAILKSRNAAAAQWAEGTGVGTDGLSAVKLASTSSALATLDASNSATYPFRSGASVSFEQFACFNVVDPLLENWFFMMVGDNDTSVAGQTTLQLSVITGGFLYAEFYWPTRGTFYTVTGATDVQDGETHHIACVFNASALTITLYVDGVADGSVAVTFGGFASTFDGVLKNVGLAAGATTVTASHIALYRTALTAAQVAAHARAGNIGGDESSLDRFDRLVALGELVDTATSGTASITAMSPLTEVAGRSLADLLQATAATENGSLTVSTSGDLTFRTRGQFYNQSAVISLGAGEYEADLTFLLDDNALVNDFTATSGNGTVYQYTDASSITANGRYAESATLDTLTDGQAETYAQMRVVTSQPAVRVPQVTVDLLTQQTTAATLWAVELLGSLVTLAGLPSTAPASSVTLQVQGYTESFSLSAYTLTANTTPAPAAVWVLGSATLGILGSTTRLGY